MNYSCVILSYKEPIEAKKDIDDYLNNGYKIEGYSTCYNNRLEIMIHSFVLVRDKGLY